MDELIRKEDVVQLMAEYISCDFPRFDWAVESVRDVLQQLSTIEHKYGKWNMTNSLMGIFECSECLKVRNECTPFCPSCGADMRKGAYDEA